MRSARTMSARCARASLVAAARPVPALAARWNSNQAGQADQKQQIRAAIKENDRLQSDWSENVLSYEQLLPKTESPTPVGPTARLPSLVLTQVPGHIPHRRS